MFIDFSTTTKLQGWQGTLSTSHDSGPRITPRRLLRASRTVSKLPRSLFPSERNACISFVGQSLDHDIDIRIPISMQISCCIHQVESLLCATSIKVRDTPSRQKELRSRYSLAVTNPINDLPLLKPGNWFWDVRNRGCRL
jgi:hypothetical protein